MVVNTDFWGESEDDIEFFHQLMKKFEEKTNIKKEGIIFVIESLNHSLFKINSTTGFNNNDDAELTVIANNIIQIPLCIKDLINSFIDLSIEKFGGLALYTINKFGIYTTKDIGRCIGSFIQEDQFVKSRMFSKTKIDDIVNQFENIVDLNEALSMEKYINRLPIPN